MERFARSQVAALAAEDLSGHIRPARLSQVHVAGVSVNGRRYREVCVVRLAITSEVIAPSKIPIEARLSQAVR